VVESSTGWRNEAPATADSLNLLVDLLPSLQPASELGRVASDVGGVRIDAGQHPGAFAAAAALPISGGAAITVEVLSLVPGMSISIRNTATGDLDFETEITGSAPQLLHIDLPDAAGRAILFRTANAAQAPAVLVKRLELQGADYSRYPVVDTVIRQAPFAAGIKDRLQQALLDLDVRERFSLPQGLTLAAAVADFRPTVILDLGTCTGGSAFCMALADPSVPIYTFDIETFWQTWVLPHVSTPPANITPIVADITQFDFTSLLKDAERVMIFWDAHGFEIAGRVFSHIMPLIADKPHIVFCHDVSDNRFNDTDEGRSYGGKMMFRGYAHYDANMPTTARANLGWMTTAVDQGIALNDFCYRNRMTLCSVDYEVKVTSAGRADRGALSQIYPDGLPGFDLTFFTLNETYLRHFPSR